MGFLALYGTGALMTRCRPEQQLQKAVCQHLAVRGHHDLYWWHHPAGEYRSPVEAAIFKSIGAKPGLPDLFLLRQGKLYGLELKPEGGRLSPSQATAHVLLRQAGATIDGAAGIDAAIRQLEIWRLFKGRADVRGNE
jgi:hypothetical protein